MKEFFVDGPMRYASIQYKYLYWEISEIVFLPHWHHHMEIIKLKEGLLEITLIDETYLLEVGDVLIINPNDVHYARKISDQVAVDVYQIDLFRITENLADIQQKFLNEMFHEKRYGIHHQLSPTFNIERFLDKLQEAWVDGNLKDIELTGRRMLSELLRFEKQALEDVGGYKIYKHNLSKLKPSVSMMDHRYVEKITLDFLAEMADLSAIHYTRLFKQTMQFTPIDYLNHVRAKAAMTLLLTTNEPIALIAAMTGLKDANYFSRFFKHYSNFTPTAFRKKFQKTNTFKD